jgi:hypothetical protein
MDDWPLPSLLPDDPRNLLSAESHRLLQRGHLEAKRIQWEAEAEIEIRGYAGTGHAAQRERRKANLRAAQVVLSIAGQEYGKLLMALDKWQSCMKDEIESVANSYELLDTQRQVLRTQFFFPPIQRSEPSETASGEHPAKFQEAPAAINSIPRLEEKDRDHRRRLVDDFLRRCNEQSKTRIRRRHIWLLVGHTQARQFEYWQAASPKATTEDETNFARILQMAPERFLSALSRKGLIE